MDSQPRTWLLSSYSTQYPQSSKQILKQADSHLKDQLTEKDKSVIKSLKTKRTFVPEQKSIKIYEGSNKMGWIVLSSLKRVVLKVSTVTGEYVSPPKKKSRLRVTQEEDEETVLEIVAGYVPAGWFEPSKGVLYFIEGRSSKLVMMDLQGIFRYIESPDEHKLEEPPIQTLSNMSLICFYPTSKDLTMFVGVGSLAAEVALISTSEKHPVSHIKLVAAQGSEGYQITRIHAVKFPNNQFYALCSAKDHSGSRFHLFVRFSLASDNLTFRILYKTPFESKGSLPKFSDFECVRMASLESEPPSCLKRTSLLLFAHRGYEEPLTFLLCGSRMISVSLAD